MSDSQAVTYDQVVSYIVNMSLLDASKLVKELEDKLGVSAAAPVAVAAAGGAAAAPAVEEKTDFTIMLDEAGAEKVKVIKVVREITGLGLKEAKDLVDAAPKLVKETVPKAEAEEWLKKLKEAGAKASLK